MKGLEISERYYNEYGASMIAEKFPELEGRIAAGLSGEGSECLGYDDEISHDHDFEPSFCMWLTKEDFEKYSFPLSREYSSLPPEFLGLKRGVASPTGGARRGVLSIDGFYTKFLGAPRVPSSYAHWLSIPEHALCAATSGKVFRDDLGEFSVIRNELKKGYPGDIRLKKLASALLVAHQSGVYNYPRCLAHGEHGAARMAIYTFVKNISAIVYLLNNRYMPFYKWVFRGMRELDILKGLADPLTLLLESKTDGTEDVCRAVSGELKKQGLISDAAQTLEMSAYEINERIKDPSLRNESVFAGMIRE